MLKAILEKIENAIRFRVRELNNAIDFLNDTYPEADRERIRLRAGWWLDVASILATVRTTL